MEPGSAAKNETDGERPKAPMSKPLRIHELLGIPKSTEKSVERPRLQPFRIKLNLESTESCGKPLGTARAANIRKCLENGTADRSLVDRTGVENSTNELNSAYSHGKPIPFRVGGLSKSDGKANPNHRRLQPVNVKHLMESWEKSQTAKIAGPKCRATSLRTTNVRRKLYSGVSSPVPPRRVIGRSLATVKPQESVNNSNKPRTVVKSNTEKSAKPTKNEQQSRKSCLLPPNFICNRYIAQQANDIIFEEPTSENSSETNKNVSNSQKIFKEKKIDIENCTETINSKNHVEEKSSCISSNSNLIVDISPNQKIDKVSTNLGEIPRPSVIVGLITSTVAKKTSVSSQKSDDEKFSLPRPPLQELNKNSTMPTRRIDDTDTSLTDLLGNSLIPTENHHDPKKIYPSNIFFPQNFENNNKISSSIDRQTLSWIRGNLKLSIQTTEESLFTMKQILKSIEDVMENNSQFDDDSSKLILGNFNNNIAKIPKIMIEDFETIDEKINDDNDGVFQDKEKNTNDRNCEQKANESDKENLPTIANAFENIEEKENKDKSRRRSAKLAVVRSPKNSDDSFLMNEAELNIYHDKSKPSTPRQTTPAKRNRVDPRSRRSLREYMALKSCVSFLQTPDPKGLPTPKGDKTGTPGERRATARALSRQVLNQLNDLYDDSPE